MKEYLYTYTPDPVRFPKLNNNTLFLDIETTGFQRNSTYLTIIGLAYMKEGKIIVEQWFNDRGPEEEPILLLELEKKFRKMDSLPLLIHYNGTTFDLPYLKVKYEQYHLPTSLPECESIDLYHLSKKYKNFLELTGLKQKNLEETFGLFREDTLSGQELIETYLDSIRFSDSSLADLYLLHNKEDMEGMVFLQNLLKLNAFFQGNFSIENWDFSDCNSTLFIRLTGDFYLNKKLCFSCSGIQLTFESGIVELSVPVITLEAKYFYENYRDYFYLPLEDRAIHKSVASFVEKEFRRKATKETCYIKKTASYLPLPLPENSRQRKAFLKECCNLELFYESYGNANAFLPAAVQEENCKKVYLIHLLQNFL